MRYARDKWRVHGYKCKPSGLGSKKNPLIVSPFETQQLLLNEQPSQWLPLNPKLGVEASGLGFGVWGLGFGVSESGPRWIFQSNLCSGLRRLLFYGPLPCDG